MSYFATNFSRKVPLTAWEKVREFFGENITNFWGSSMNSSAKAPRNVREKFNELLKNFRASLGKLERLLEGSSTGNPGENVSEEILFGGGSTYFSGRGEVLQLFQWASTNFTGRMSYEFRDWSSTYFFGALWNACLKFQERFLRKFCEKGHPRASWKKFHKIHVRCSTNFSEEVPKLLREARLTSQGKFDWLLDCSGVVPMTFQEKFHELLGWNLMNLVTWTFLRKVLRTCRRKTQVFLEGKFHEPLGRGWSGIS